MAQLALLEDLFQEILWEERELEVLNSLKLRTRLALFSLLRAPAEFSPA